MRKHLMRVVNVNFSRFFKTAAVVVMITMASAAKAQVTLVAATISEVPAVTYIAGSNESLFFDVKVNNETGEKFTIVVKDDNSITLFRGTYYDKSFKKRFVIPKTDSNKLTFLIRSESGSKSETFEINTKTHVVEEVVVTKVI
jgi:hypothetical protein